MYYVMCVCVCVYEVVNGRPSVCQIVLNHCLSTHSLEPSLCEFLCLCKVPYFETMINSQVLEERLKCMCRPCVPGIVIIIIIIVIITSAMNIHHNHHHVITIYLLPSNLGFLFMPSLATGSFTVKLFIHKPHYCRMTFKNSFSCDSCSR